jgi:hypothetical protein
MKPAKARHTLASLEMTAESFKRLCNELPQPTLRIFFRIINDFVHRFILDRTFVDFTVSLIILPFDIVDFNSKSKMVKSTVKPKNQQKNRKINNKKG